MDKQPYFLKLHRYAMELLDTLPIERTPQPLEYSLEKLKPETESRKPAELQKLKTLMGDTNLSQLPDTQLPAQGLNTIGMLMDRFTILLIKEWCFRNKGGNAEKADNLYRTQTLDIIAAMDYCSPGSSSMNTKITNIKADSAAASWEDAFYGLLTINLIIWESQEVLYIKDISVLPNEELRAYLKWFSWGNIIRNEYIQLCEEFFWKGASASPNKHIL